MKKQCHPCKQIQRSLATCDLDILSEMVSTAREAGVIRIWDKVSSGMVLGVTTKVATWKREC